MDEIFHKLAPVKTKYLSWRQLDKDHEILEKDDVHVWLAPIIVSPSTIERYDVLLDPHEVAQSERFQRVVHRNRYIVTKILVRLILSRYLQVQPKCLRFFYNEHGKPLLGRPGDVQGVNFSLSHSSGLALLAIAHQGRRIGVDLEKKRTMASVNRIAKKFFPAEECATLRIMAEPLKSRTFLRAWTIMEAYVKAQGIGLAAAVKNRQTFLLDKIISHARGHINNFPWSISCWEPTPEYVASLVVEGSGCQVSSRELKNE
jgi:4'-phosphopantetheinyl transferase